MTKSRETAMMRKMRMKMSAAVGARPARQDSRAVIIEITLFCAIVHSLTCSCALSALCSGFFSTTLCMIYLLCSHATSPAIMGVPGTHEKRAKGCKLRSWLIKRSLFSKLQRLVSMSFIDSSYLNSLNTTYSLVTYFSGRRSPQGRY